MTIKCQHTAAGFFSCSLRGVFADYRVMTVPSIVHVFVAYKTVKMEVQIVFRSCICPVFRIQFREGVSI